MVLRRFVLMMVLVAVPVAAQTMCEQVKALTGDPTVAAAHWGVAVATMDGTLLCGVNEGQLFRPASNNKIFTTGTALAMIGPAATVETRVTGKFDPATGVVSGDLKLVGGGDANFDSNDLPYLPPVKRPKTPVVQGFHDLEDLAAQLVAKGVKTITGDVVGDDTYFPYEPYPPSWNGDDFVWGYGAPVSALTIADNEMKLTITPGLVTGERPHETFHPATVVLEQNGVSYYTLQALVYTGPAKAKAGVGVERLPGSRIIRVYGMIAADAPPDVEEIAIDDPAAYAAMAFKSILLAHGISITGSSRAEHQQVTVVHSNAEMFEVNAHVPMSIDADAGSRNEIFSPNNLAVHTSAALSEDVMYTNKVSQNLHAELLLHRLGSLGRFGDGSTFDGARTIRAYVTQAGLQKDDFMLYDGSGLSDHDLIAPRALVKFLGYAVGQPWFAQFKASLPDAGVDGTLTSRFKAPIAFQVSAKTGTLGESRALSGYLTRADGKTLIFSVMVDTHLPTTSADRTIMDKIVETIASGN